MARKSLCLLAALTVAIAGAAFAARPYPILFVTQVPLPGDFTGIASVFGNHQSDIDLVPRGGDLWILYPDGSTRNLTREAGFGVDGFQGAQSIAVRDPSVHWTGTKALFSLLIGAPTQQYVRVTTYWQIYEITGLGKGETVHVTQLAKQPAGYNNITPVYSPDGRILFTSDRPRNGKAHLWPQLDEYEEAPVVSGLWSLDPASGALELLDHTPSGAFTPIVDSAGRIVYTRWDHLQRDQQADADRDDVDDGQPPGYGTFNYASEAANAARLPERTEIYPEPRRAKEVEGTNVETFSFNQFFPWAINPDGSEHETLNHVGRHELHRYFNRAFNDDPSIVEFISANSGRHNENDIENLLEIKEDPSHPGRFVGVDAPEFYTHAAGGVVRLDSPLGLPADGIDVTYVNHPDSRLFNGDTEPPPSGSTGHYRDPLPLSDGTLVAVHTAETRADRNDGTREHPTSRYAFRLKALVDGPGGYSTAGSPLTGGISKSISYYDPDALVSWSGTLWELQPVEVRSRPKPPLRAFVLPAPEAQVFSEEGVDPQVFRAWLVARGLAVAVSRNVTTRDIADRQQPFNLEVAGGGAQTLGDDGRIYAVSHLQIFQADQIRGLGGLDDPRPGRRVLAQTLHDATNPANGGPAGSVKVWSDGSVAAYVPAGRALTWQLTNGTTPVVRERYWLTLKSGEVRVCTSCHGPNTRDQAGDPSPVNPPLALRQLVRDWKSTQAGCAPGPTTLCLASGRFKLEVAWHDAQNHSGNGHALPINGQNGAFWFTDAKSVDLAVKVLDGRGVNGSFWAFYGGLSNVAYTLTVTDSATGRSHAYSNAQGTLASAGDTASFPAPPSSAFATDRDQTLAAASCQASNTVLCLQGARFKVQATFTDAHGKQTAARFAALNPNNGYAWSTAANDLQLLLKIVDGRPVNGKFWFFSGALTNGAYLIKVTDTTSGKVKTYSNPRGRFHSFGDTRAF